MALRAASRSLLRNLDNIGPLSQTSASTICRVDNSQILVKDARPFQQTINITRQPSRLISTTLSPLLNAEKADSLSADSSADYSVIDDPFASPESAASLIQAQVDNAVASLPLTERLFAVVQVDGKQYRVSQDDVLTVEDW